METMMTVHPLRLRPGQDLLLALDELAAREQLEAACILTCVGSLRRAVLRLADREEATTFEGKHEIVSLTGTFSKHGGHYHVSLSDGTGRTVGGHVLPGCVVYTTAEIVVGVLAGVAFLREYDPESGYEELTVVSKTDYP